MSAGRVGPRRVRLLTHRRYGRCERLRAPVGICDRAPPESVELTLHNDSSTELILNPFQWTIRRQTTPEWETVEQRSSGNGRLALSPGATHSWTLGEVVDFVSPETSLEAGTYTAAIGVPDPDGSDWTRCLALIRLG